MSEEPIDVQLIVTRDRLQSNGSELRYILNIDQASTKSHWISSKTFSNSPSDFACSLLNDIESLDLTNSNERLSGLGVQLFEELLPYRLKKLLWTNRKQINSLQILSNVSAVPWELLRLVDPDSPSSQGKFFAQLSPLTKWLFGYEPRRCFSLQRVAIVVDRESASLDHSIPEIAAIERTLSSTCEVKVLRAHRASLIRHLQKESFDAWHFILHGASTRRGVQLHLENSDTLTPEDLYGISTKLHETQPLVFLNACSAGRLTETLNSIGGLVQAFIRAGAGAVVAAQWRITDRAAAIFAQRFYEEVASRKTTVDKAVYQARLAVREKADAGDSSWIAFTCFSDADRRATQVPISEPAADPIAEPHSIEPAVNQEEEVGPLVSENVGSLEESQVSQNTTRGVSPESPRTSPRETRSPNILNQRKLRHSEENPTTQNSQARRELRSDLIPISSGIYKIGSNQVPLATPCHRVYLNAFAIGRLPVTNSQYREFLDANPQVALPPYLSAQGFADPDQPVVGVTWYEARMFSRWVGLSLPTETQWEAAARGPNAYPYPWGYSLPDRTRASFGDELRYPEKVGVRSSGASSQGVEDLAGNVWEWCLDSWSPQAYRHRDQSQDPAYVSNKTDMHTVRGGCWRTPSTLLPSYNRQGLAAEARLPYQGFRCALTTILD